MRRALTALAEFLGGATPITRQLVTATAVGHLMVNCGYRSEEARNVMVIAFVDGTRIHSSDPVQIVSEVAHRKMWPRASLGWAFPRADDVERALHNDAGDGGDVFAEIRGMLLEPPPAARVILPEPAGAYATLIALWIMGSYLLRARCSATPIR